MACIAAATMLLAPSCAELIGDTAAQRQAGDRSSLDKSADNGRSGNTDNGTDPAANDEDGFDRDSDGSTTGGARGSRTASYLPPSISQVWEVDETGLYITADEGATEVVAFDLSTGIELYRVDTHPAGSLRGISPSLYIDEERNRFIAARFDDGFGRWDGELVVHDLDTGDVVWESAMPFGGLPLFDCGPEQVCARSDAAQAIYSLADRDLVDTVDATSATVIAADGDRFVTIARNPDNLDVFVGLAGHAEHGRRQLWTLDSAELTDATGIELDPGWGWSGDVDSASGVAALTLANTDWETTGAAVGVDMATGEVAWARPGVTDCLFNYPEARPMLKCVASENDDTLVDRIVRIDPATGSDLWTIAVAEPFSPYEVEIVHGTEYLYVWVGEQVLVYDLVDGRPVVTAGPYLCANSVWTYDVEYYDDEEPWEYYADTLVVLCDADGFLLHPVDVADLLSGTDIDGSDRVSFDWELRPFVLEAIPSQMIDGDSGEA